MFPKDTICVSLPHLILGSGLNGYFLSASDSSKNSGEPSHAQLATLTTHNPQLTTHNPQLSTHNYQISTINSQTHNYQISTHKLTTVKYQISTINSQTHNTQLITHNLEQYKQGRENVTAKYE